MKNYQKRLSVLTGTVLILISAQSTYAETTKLITDEDFHQQENPFTLNEKELSKITFDKLPLTEKTTLISSDLSTQTLINQNSLLSYNQESLPLNPENLIPGNSLPQQEIITPTQPSELLAQTLINPNSLSSSNQEVLVPNPEILIDGNAVSQQGIGISNQLPTAPTDYAPDFLPRAVAPPVGDIAISNISTSFDRVNLGTAILVPRLVLRDAPAREVLALLARAAGLNIVFTDSQSSMGQQPGPGGGGSNNPTVSLDLQNEPVEEVFNSVLLISGLNANRRGNTIFIGARLPEAARNLISRTLRLNQITAENAATFLATQGASVQRVVTPTEEVTDPITQRTVRIIERPAQIEPLIAKEAEGSIAPLLLRGLQVSTSDRINAITLVGEPRKVEIATSFLTQLDARRRQVAVNVKVVDVNLNNIEDFSSSFSFGINDTYFVQDDGTAIVNFGGTNTPNVSDVRTSAYYPTVVPFNQTIPNGSEAELIPFFDQQLGPFSDVTRGFNDFTQSTSPYARPNFGTNNNAFQPGLSDVNIDPQTGQIEYEYTVPGLFQYPDKFLLTLDTQIQSGNAKILTDPTLVVQEGQEATVKLVQQVVASVSTEVDPLSGVRTTTPEIEEAGLIVTVKIDKIDDNGFVSFSVSPSVSAIGGTQEFDSGAGSTNTISLLNERQLSSGIIRLRDGQTLIVSGIIQETDRTTISKVPILGDIPILGALFRSTSQESDRREVIILLTPQILDDSEGSTFGYNYTPSRAAREMLQKQGFPVQPGQ